MSARYDYEAGGEAAYTGADAFGVVLDGDVRDMTQMQAFAPTQAAPWWQSLIMYGATRAIDNRFAPPSVAGNVHPGSGSGQSGATYRNRPQAESGTVTREPDKAGGGSGMLLLLAGVAALAFAALA